MSGDLLQRVRSACEQHGVPISLFGRVAIRDANIVNRLAPDKAVTKRTSDRIEFCLRDIERIAERSKESTRLSLLASERRRKALAEPRQTVSERIRQMLDAGCSMQEIKAALGCDLSYLNAVRKAHVGVEGDYDDRRFRASVTKASAELARRVNALYAREAARQRVFR